MASITVFEDENAAGANEMQHIVIIDDSDEDQLEAKSSKQVCQTATSAKKRKSSEATYSGVYHNAAADSLENATSNRANQSYKIHGFVGVEYVVKVCDDTGKAVRYECALCELCFSFSDIRKHLLDYSHRLKYCEQHFSTAVQQFRRSIANKPKYEHKQMMVTMLQKLAEAIEKYHGRAQAYECHEKRFKRDSFTVIDELFTRSHASEENGPTFTDVINSLEVGNLSNSDAREVPIVGNFNSTTSSSATKDTNFNPQIPEGYILKLGDEMRAHFTMSQPYHNDVAFVTQSHIEPQACLAQSAQSSEQPQQCALDKGSSLTEDTFPQDRWRRYRQYVDLTFDALKERFQQYTSNPESYPAYNECHQKFCHSRTAELKAMGKDNRDYHFQSDWLSFFNNHIKEQCEETFESFKVRLREELSLPLTNDCISDKKYYVSVKPTEIETAVQPIEPSAIIDLEQPNDTSKNSTTESQEISSFVAVLGLLSAMEAYLGCLGPKINDLLTKALSAEKSGFACSLKLMDEENCALLETVREKFKGLIIANILDGDIERALIMAIGKITAFLEANRNNNRPDVVNLL